MNVARLRWIDTWAQGWRRCIRSERALRDCLNTDYVGMPLEVAVDMLAECVAALRDPTHAISLLATETMESGREIGEAIDEIRAKRAA